jgi:hypothetical protein
LSNPIKKRKKKSKKHRKSKQHSSSKKKKNKPEEEQQEEEGGKRKKSKSGNILLTSEDTPAVAVPTPAKPAAKKKTVKKIDLDKSAGLLLSEVSGSEEEEESVWVGIDTAQRKKIRDSVKKRCEKKLRVQQRRDALNALLKNC